LLTVCENSARTFTKISLGSVSYKWRSAKDAALVAEKTLAALAAPHMVGGRQLCLTASIGISIYPDHGRDTEELVHSADIAMYKAKKSGGHNYRFFE